MTGHRTWKRRFRSPILSSPTWAADDPDCMGIGSTGSGSDQPYAWNRAKRLDGLDAPIPAAGVAPMAPATIQGSR